MQNAKNWIAEATKNKGALTKKAKKSGEMTKSSTIKKEYLVKSSKSPNMKLKKEAILAITLGKLRKA